MSKKIVNAKGLLCPKPLILTKKALDELAVDEEMTVLIDNETSKENVERFCIDNGATVSVETKDDLFMLTVRKESGDLSHPDAAAYCTASPPPAPHVVCFDSNTMGSGSDELGGILVRACINTIKDVSPLPGAIIFYNSGVFLTTADSPVAGGIRDLAERGVTVLVCGTCADYYQVKDTITVGTISNMYTILETLTRASHVVKP